MENKNVVYCVMGSDIANNFVLYMLAEKVVYKPDHFQLLSGDTIVGTFDYKHRAFRVESVVRPNAEGGE